MKKSYVYFVIPLLTLVVFFFGFYWNAHKDYEARGQAKIEKAKAEKEQKLLKEAKDREIAVKSAIEMQEKRKKEKQERDIRDAREKEEREKSRQAREKSARDADKAEATVKRLQKEIEVAKKEIVEAQAEKKRVMDEQNFLKEYVKKAEANTRSLTGVLERIEAADRAAEAARKAAEAAAKAATKKS